MYVKRYVGVYVESYSITFVVSSLEDKLYENSPFLIVVVSLKFKYNVPVVGID